ncbi:MAG: PEP-utilizing enzyme [Acidimicrobiales bacterium]
MTEIDWPADSGPSKRWPIYTRGNIGEVYPDIVLPLEWDLGGLPSERAWRRGAAAVGFATADDVGSEEFVVLGVFGGYAYFNVSLMRLLGVRAPGLGPDVIDTQFLGDADVPGYSQQPGDKNLGATLRVIRTALSTMRATSVPLVDEMTRRVDTFRAEAPPLDSPDEMLWDYVKSGLAELWEFLIGSHVINTMQATIAAGGLTDLCEKRLGDPNLAVALTTGIGDVVSAEPAAEMWKLANETEPENYDRAFARFIERYGHRGPNEFSLMGRDWAAFPDLATAAIDTMRGVDPDRSPPRQRERMATERAEAVAATKARLGWRGRRLDKAIATTALWSRAREESKNQVIRGNQLARHAFLELLRRAEKGGGVADNVGPLLLRESEFLAYLADPPSMVATIEQRRADYQHLKGLEPPFAFDTSAHGGAAPPISTWSPRRTSGDTPAVGSVLHGAAGAPGVASGRARVILDPADPRAMEPGDVLVAPLTDPSWTPLFVSAAAVVVEVGAAMSHSMIVSRELGIPCVVGVEDATLRIADGTELEVDGQAGTVRLL